MAAITATGVCSQLSRPAMATQAVREDRDAISVAPAMPMSAPHSRPSRIAIWATCLRSFVAIGA